MIAVLLATRLISGAGGAAVEPAIVQAPYTGWTRAERDYYRKRNKAAVSQVVSEAIADPVIEALPAIEQAPAKAAIKQIVRAQAALAPEYFSAIESNVSAQAAKAVAKWRAERTRKRNEDESIVLLMLNL